MEAADMRRLVAGGVIAALGLFSAMPAIAGAQGIGVTAGYSYGSVPNQNGVLPGTLSAHSGIAVGVRATSGGLIGWGIEGMYAERGFESSSAGSSQRLSYIDVPFTIRVGLPGPGVSPFAYLGPQGSYELHCDAGGGATCPSGREKMTYAGIVGGGLRFGSLMGLSVEGRYVYGLTNLNYGTVSNSGSYKSRSFMLLAGLGF
jgi:hypothetical protein